MLAFSKEELSAKEQYNILIGTIIPRPIALVSTMNEQGIVNLAPFSFFTIVSHHPAILSISIQRDAEGNMKDTARNLMETGEAVVHMVTEDNLEKVNKTAKQLAAHESELSETNMTLVASHAITVPGVAESSARFETTLLEHIEIKDGQGRVATDLVLLAVEHFHLSDAIYQEGHINAPALKPVSRLAGSDYMKLGDTIQLARP